MSVLTSRATHLTAGLMVGSLLLAGCSSGSTAADPAATSSQSAASTGSVSDSESATSGSSQTTGGSPSSTSAGSSTGSADPAAIELPCEPGSLTDKRVLLSPYWLDNFNTANTYWQQKYLQDCGASQVDIVNPDATASKQLTTIETAIASGSYDLIAWAPVDPVAATTTIRRIQDANLLQLVNFASFPPGSTPGLDYAATWVDRTQVYTEMATDAANYIKAHPELGPPRIAYVSDLPASQQCTETFNSLVDGVKAVSPDAEVVYNEGATSQADAVRVMTDFISRDIDFNIYAGCGGAVSLGGIAAIQQAGLGNAVNKQPEHVYEMSLDASPPELQLLWDETSSLMRSGLFGPRTAAAAGVRLMDGLLSGDIAPTAAVDEQVGYIKLTPDCATSRPQALAEFEGVPGFDIPECSFEYAGE